MNAAEQFRAFMTIVRKEIRRYLRIWTQTLLPSAITMSLYFVIFGTLIGSRIGEMGGFTYMEFVVPGLIMMAIVTNSYSNVVSSFFGSKFNHSVEELLVSPTPNYVILMGYVVGGISRGLLVAIVVTLVSLLFTRLQIHSYFVVIAIVLMTSTLFALAGFINAIIANSFDDITIIPTFVLTPLTYLGGIFYSIKLLPEFWQTVSLGNPILYMVNAFRYGMLGASDISIGVAYAIIIAAVVVLYVTVYQLLTRGTGIRS